MDDDHLNSLFLKCFIGSLTFHALALGIFFYKPLANPIETDLIVESKYQHFSSWQNKEDKLAQAFQHFILSREKFPLVKIKDSVNFLTTHTSNEPETVSPLQLSELVFPDPLSHPIEILKESSIRIPLPIIELPHMILQDIPSTPFVLKEPSRLSNPFNNLSSPLSTRPWKPPIDSPVCYSSKQEKVLEPLSLETPKEIIKPFSSDFFYHQNQMTSPEFKLPRSVFSSTPKPSLLYPNFQPSLERFTSLEHYGFSQSSLFHWKDLFDVDLKLYPQEEGSYLFSLTFFGKTNLTEHALKQNYYFIIDRTASIDKYRYQTFKRGVVRALACLREGDFFNIFIFDSKITQFSKEPLCFNKKTQQAAQRFLEDEPHQHHRKSVDIYSALIDLLPYQKKQQEAHTVILITDGKGSLHTQQQKHIIETWLTQSQGKISLYTAAVGQENNILFLDLLSRLSRGHLMYSDTHASFPRKLAKLVSTLRSPIAKEMSFTLVSSDPKSRLKLYPPPMQLPDLFCHHPYVLLGKIEKPTDFVLMIQGKHKGTVLNIKKQISFKQAKTATSLFLKEWKAFQAHLYYEKYLLEEKPIFLEKAMQHLSLQQDAAQLKEKRR